MSKYIGISTQKRRQKAGFSLAEVLLVVALISILAGFIGVNAVSMYKNMKQTQLDKTAETIFHAAQNRLSELYAYGKTDDLKIGSTVEDSGKKLMFITSDDSGKKAYDAIMGQNTVSAEILSNLWIIEYQASTCRVLNVVYAEANDSGLGGFGERFNASTDINAIKTALLNRAFDGRKNKFGWYGDELLADLQLEEKQIGNTSVDVDIINEENLYAHVRVSVGWEDNLSNQTEVVNFLNKVSINLTIMDATTGGAIPVTPTYTIPASQLISGTGLNSDANGFYNGKSDADDSNDYLSNKYLSASWDVLLDSLYANAFTGSDNTVKTVNGHASSVTPGDNFYLIAKLVSNEGVVPEVQDYDVDNSLFAAYSDGKAYIEYGRHLQNIGNAAISGINAVQIADLDFDLYSPVNRGEDFDEFNKYWVSVYPNTDAYGHTNYLPYSTTNLISYDGQNRYIKNIKINKLAGDAAGLFGVLTGVTDIKNVIITESEVNAPDAITAGMFAAKISSGSTVNISNCYLNKVSVDGASGSQGGFVGEISATTVSDCGMLSVSAGSASAAENAGAIAGDVKGQFIGKRLFVFGGELNASTESGGLIGNADASYANLTINGCKISGTKITSTSGNSGGFVGSSKNLLATIDTDSAVAGCIIRASSGNAGGFIGNTESIVNIKDSEYYMPTLSESDETAGIVSKEFADIVGLSGITVKYNDLVTLANFKYVHELKPSLVYSVGWINGNSNAGGLIGTSNKNITIVNTYAAGVLSSVGNSGGFVGRTTGVLSVTGSYTNFYISGKNVGGFAAACDQTSNFNSCYTAGFLVGTADSAGGFAPVNIGTVTNSYSVFNFDNVADTGLFTGTALSDTSHDVNLYGTAANYPNVATHSYYPVAPSVGGTAYYVYSEVDVEEKDNIIRITAQELAENKMEGETTPLLSGSFSKEDSTLFTIPYSLSSFFVKEDGSSVLNHYPYPSLKVDKVKTVTADATAEETHLKHHNDWLIIDSDKTSIEVWYMMYNENMTGLKTDVVSIGNTGIKYIRKAKAVQVNNGSSTEYQINVGSRDKFSGFKFVGYYDPVTASKPLTYNGSSAMDRSKKFDYPASGDLAQSVRNSMNTGDIVVQTSISGTNTFGYQCADHYKVFEEDDSSIYTETRRIYAVYRFNKPYTVKLSYVEYVLPSKDIQSESKPLKDIYEGSKVASTDNYEVTYAEPSDGYEVIYQDLPEIRERVRLSHNKIGTDEELTEDYIADMVLYQQYSSNQTKYKSALDALDEKRAEANQKIVREISDFTDAGFELFDIDKLKNAGLVHTRYAQDVKAKPVYTIVRINPDEKDYAGNEIQYKDRCKEVSKTNDNKITMQTHKSFEYVILYNSNKSGLTLNLVFRNTEPNSSSTFPVVSRHDVVQNDIESRPYSAKVSNTYTVRVGIDGFVDINQGLSILMTPGSHPIFNGFTLNETDSTYNYTGSTNTVTLYYDRNKYSLSFALNNNSEDPAEKYIDSQSRATIDDLYYGQPIQEKLWEIGESDIPVNITGRKQNDLKNSDLIYIGTSSYGYFYPDRQFDNYGQLENYVRQLTGDRGTFQLYWYYRNSYSHESGTYTWTKSDGTFTYAFNRNGYILTGFKVYEQDSNGNYTYNGITYKENEDKETYNVEDIVKMSDKNMLVKPQWTRNPAHLRVEIYYQSAYDNFNETDESKKQYELYKGTTCAVSGGVVTGKENGGGRVTPLHDTLRINALVASEKTGLVDFLEPYFEAGDFDVRSDHNLTGPDLNIFVPNEANSVRYGKPHFEGNDDTMVVALYYDRKEVEIRFHFITGNNYKVPNHNSYTIRSQWNDFKNNSPLYQYTGTDEYHLKLKAEIDSMSNTFVPIGKYAKVKITSGNHYAKSGTSITYGGLSGNNYTTGTTTNHNSIQYGVTMTYQALYGAPAVFSSDGESLIPDWWCYRTTTSKTAMRQYITGGSSTLFYRDFSLKYFKDINASVLDFDLYPSYPGDSAGYTRFYTERAPGDKLPGDATDWPVSRTRSDDSASVADNMFSYYDIPTIETYGRSRGTGTVLKNGSDMRIFIDGYTTYAYALDNRVLNYNIPASAGNNPASTNIYILLMRDTYYINFFDTALKPGVTFDTSYLYKQVINRLPKEDEIVNPKGTDYTFDGWYTSSAYTTKIANAQGEIEDDYLALSSTLVNSSGKLLMNCENLQAFPKWAPTYCNISFNPFYPDIKNYGEDERLTISPNPVPYGNTIDQLPDVQVPQGYTNRAIETDGTDLYYTIKNDRGEYVRKYKFLGWYTYAGLNVPSDMSSLEVPFIAGTTKVSDDTVLYAKWEQTYGKAIYTITCYDYTNGGVELFKVKRSGDAGTNVTINPPKYNDDHGDDIEVIGSYASLENYEALSNSVTTSLADGMEFKFRYKEISAWQYIVKNCINVNGQDVVISSSVEHTTYFQKQVEAPDIVGYDIYEYQIGNSNPVPKYDTTEFIQVNKPTDSSDTVEIVIRYRLQSGKITAKQSATYFLYDNIDFANITDGVFNWQDNTYAPAIIYSVDDGIEAYEYIGNSADEAISTQASQTISDRTPSTRNVDMKLVAINKEDPTSYLELGEIGRTSVTFTLSSYWLKFTDTSVESYVYYVIGSNDATKVGNWYWDKELTSSIGADGTSIIQADISTLPVKVQEKAQIVKTIVSDANNQNKYFFIFNGSEAYTVVDNFGKLRNGAYLEGNRTAYVTDGTGTQYTIDLYSTTGEIIGQVMVDIP